MNINKKSFKLINRKNKTFSLFISGFQFATTLIFRIIQQLDILFVATILSKASATINVKKIKLLVSIVKLITKITQTINAKYIKINYSMKQIMKFVVIINSQIDIIFISRAKQKIITIINEGKIHVTATAIYAIFNLLGDFDPQTLGTLDTQTLGTMDYTLT